MESRRLFFALVPDDAVRAAIQASAKELAIKMQPQGKKSIPPENYHLTMQFLGDVNPEQEATIRRAAQYIDGRPVSLTLNVARSFPESGTWWIGPNEAPPELKELRAELSKICSKAGIPGDRARFAPHVTLMKVKESLTPTVITPIQWDITDFALLHSIQGATGSVYTVVERWPLRGVQQGGLF